MKKSKWIVKFCLNFILLAFLIWIIILGTLQTDSGQKWLFSRVLRYFEEATATKIQVKKIHLFFPLTLHLEDVAFLRNDHPILKIKELNICCAYTTLLQGRLVFSNIQASDIDVLEPLQTDESPSIKTSSLQWESPPLPFYLKFQNIDIQNIKLHGNLISQLKLSSKIEELILSSTFSLNGLVSNNPFKSSLKANLLIANHNNQTESPSFSLGINLQNHELSFFLQSKDVPLQLIESDLPASITGGLTFYSSAPVAVWQSIVTHPEEGREPIKGHFEFALKTLDKNAHSDIFSRMIGKESLLKGLYTFDSQNRFSFTNLILQSPHLSLKGDAILNSDELFVGNSRWRFQKSHFNGIIHDVSSLSEGWEQSIKGKLYIEGDLSENLLSPIINIRLKTPQFLIADLSFQNINSTLQLTRKENALQGSVALSFDHQKIPYKAFSSFNWNESKQLTLSDLQVDALNAHIEGQMTGSYPDFIWEGFLKGHSNDISGFSQFLPIPISGEGELKLQFMGIQNHNQVKEQQYQADFLGRTLRSQDWKAEQLTLSLFLEPLTTQPLIFHVQGLLKGEALEWNDYSTQAFSADFTHDLNFKKFVFINFAGQWESKNIKWLEGSGERATGHIHIDNSQEISEGESQFTLNNFKTALIQIDELKGSTTILPKESHWPFFLTGRGFWKDDLLFSLEGNWHFFNRDLEIEVDRLTGLVGPYPLEMKEKALFYSKESLMHLDHLWLQLGEGELQGDFHLEKDNIFAQFKTNEIPSELFHYINPNLPLTGKANLIGNIAGSLKEPSGQLQINLKQMQIIEDIFAKKPLIGGTLSFNFDEKGLQLTSELKGIGDTPLLISGQLPYKLSLDPLLFKMHPELPFNLALSAEGELDPYLHLLYNDTTNLSGQTKIALNISGDIDHPEIKGNIDFIDGSYESLSTGALYHNIQAKLEGDGSKIVLKNLSAEDGKGGKIDATGLVNLDVNEQIPFEFEITPSHIFILDSDYVDISASGQLRLVGNTKGAKLQGELKVDQAKIHLEEALPQKIKTIEINYLNIFENDPVFHHFDKRERIFPLEFNVKLNAPENVSIEGNHIKSEWKGSLLLTGSPENPQLNGDLRIEHGEYDFNGKVFNLSQGNIHFAGAIDKKTTLYVVASKEIDRIKAEIIVKGAVNKPVISFRSSPPLSQREILSYILFNRGISNITQDQGDQLTQSFISLNSSDQTKSSNDLLSRLRNNIGIDHLDFTTTNSNANKEFGLQVGKHITDNLMVTVNNNLVSISPVIAVEAKLRKNLKVQAEAGFDESTPIRMSIKWKKDY